MARRQRVEAPIDLAALDALTERALREADGATLTALVERCALALMPEDLEGARAIYWTVARPERQAGNRAPLRLAAEGKRPGGPRQTLVSE